jgi:hypothetical protein
MRHEEFDSRLQVSARCTFWSYRCDCAVIGLSDKLEIESQLNCYAVISYFETQLLDFAPLALSGALSFDAPSFKSEIAKVNQVTSRQRRICEFA